MDELKSCRSGKFLGREAGDYLERGSFMLGLFVHNVLLVVVLVLLAYSSRLFAQTPSSGAGSDQVCRTQAKEVALNAYSTCMAEIRQKQLDSLKDEYESKIQDLKTQYEKELQKLSSDPQKNSSLLKGMSPDATKTPTGQPSPLKKNKKIETTSLKISDSKVSSKSASKRASPTKTNSKALKAPAFANSQRVPRSLPAKKVVSQAAVAVNSSGKNGIAVILPSRVEPSSNTVEDSLYASEAEALDHREADARTMSLETQGSSDEEFSMKPGVPTNDNSSSFQDTDLNASWGETFQQFNEEPQ
jgi:hypothetical protein